MLTPRQSRLSENSTVLKRQVHNILNLRDVGKTINQATGTKLIVEGRLYRSARPDFATLSDRRVLQDDFGLKTIMDLRTTSELVRQAKKRQENLNTSALLRPNDVLAESLKIPGIDYVEISINGKGFERSLLRQLSVWSFLMKAISILGREVMLPRGLVGLGYDSIDHCGAEISQALHEFASVERYPILVHCTQGKDRTGLLVALILFLLNVPLDAITEDYCLSESELLSERESWLAEIEEIGLSEEFADAPKDWIVNLHEYLLQHYGGIRNYLLSIGVRQETQDRLVYLLCY